MTPRNLFAFPNGRMQTFLAPLLSRGNPPLPSCPQTDNRLRREVAHAAGVAALSAVRHAACSAFFRVAPVPYARCVPEASQTATRISPCLGSFDSITYVGVQPMTF